jgi:hypothetical protein
MPRILEGLVFGTEKNRENDFNGAQNLPDVSADQNGMKGAYR